MCARHNNLDDAEPREQDATKQVLHAIRATEPPASISTCRAPAAVPNATEDYVAPACEIPARDTEEFLDYVEEHPEMFDCTWCGLPLDERWTFGNSRAELICGRCKGCLLCGSPLAPDEFSKCAECARRYCC